jgi:HTH-type transcriptional regulator / antitoxin HigA
MTPATTARRAPRPIDKPIRNKAAFAEAVAELDAIIDQNPKEGTREYDRMDLLSILIAAYEADNLPAPRSVSPQEVVRFMAEQRGTSSGELAVIMGGRSRLSDFYSGRRALSTGQILKLRAAMGIPADLLIGSRAKGAA